MFNENKTWIVGIENKSNNKYREDVTKMDRQKTKKHSILRSNQDKNIR